ncbi:hypothetical protein [Kibdelosporangium phytohabitans]|uniref:hypothetical protein n=1 Tax=Kibdelosporangium phytohabitans TaxID=860235 RepID=UPI0012F9AEF5|nr:hypothetical protein [Kibdelosporangium phytohabitans]MBE1465110.1 hypothetical protein [Kibdelosporangium phytohabitans]
MQCTVRRPLPLLAWAALPLLVTAVVLGFTSLGELLLGASGETVLTSAHAGAAAGLTAMVGYSIEWPAGWRKAHWTYAAVILIAGFFVHGTNVPPIVAITLGVPGAALLLRMTWLHRAAGKRGTVVRETEPKRRVVQAPSMPRPAITNKA